MEQGDKRETTLTIRDCFTKNQAQGSNGPASFINREIETSTLLQNTNASSKQQSMYYFRNHQMPTFYNETSKSLYRKNEEK